MCTVSRSVMFGNATAGLEADPGAQLYVDYTEIANNGTGVQAYGNVALGNSGIVSNTTGISGTTTSYGNNRIFATFAAGQCADAGSVAPRLTMVSNSRPRRLGDVTNPANDAALRCTSEASLRRCTFYVILIGASRPHRLIVRTINTGNSEITDQMLRSGGAGQAKSSGAYATTRKLA